MEHRNEAEPDSIFRETSHCVDRWPNPFSEELRSLTLLSRWKISVCNQASDRRPSGRGAFASNPVPSGRDPRAYGTTRDGAYARSLRYICTTGFRHTNRFRTHNREGKSPHILQPPDRHIRHRSYVRLENKPQPADASPSRSGVRTPIRYPPIAPNYLRSTRL